jgi:hypothetical protein
MLPMRIEGRYFNTVASLTMFDNYRVAGGYAASGKLKRWGTNPSVTQPQAGLPVSISKEHAPIQ